MAWAKNGTPSTLGSELDVITISDMTGVKFNQFLFHEVEGSDNRDTELTFNNIASGVYTRRYSTNGTTDLTQINQNEIETAININTPIFFVAYVVSISGEEKLIILNSVDQRAPGDVNEPQRQKLVGKFVPSPDADITRIDINNTQSGGYGADTNLSAIGTN